MQASKLGIQHQSPDCRPARLKPVLTDKPALQKKDSRSGDRAEQAYNTMYDQSPYSQDEEKNAQSSYMDYSAVRHDMTAAHEPAAMA
jgi:hypothetical protein